MGPIPDLERRDDLEKLIDELTKKEQTTPDEHRILRGKIDLLRAELQARLQETGGRVLEDVDGLTGYRPSPGRAFGNVTRRL